MVFESIRKVKPKKLYLIADGPKDKQEAIQCLTTRNVIEESIDWECEIQKIYSEENLGCARRIQTGLDSVFQNETRAIILEDDTLPNESFFDFCEEMLLKYENDDRVFHISGCNFFPSKRTCKSSYHLSSIVNIWGWATWSRAWKKYDLKMMSWKRKNKEEFLKEWCSDKRLRKDTLKMFDLHCNNQDPWTWDYQWVYTCWENNGLSIIPSKNLVQNIGFGPEGTHTKFETEQGSYPRQTSALAFPLTHPKTARNLSFEKEYFKSQKPGLIQRTKYLLKNICN
jgi:hypothetical protein